MMKALLQYQGKDGVWHQLWIIPSLTPNFLHRHVHLCHDYG